MSHSIPADNIFERVKDAILCPQPEQKIELLRAIKSSLADLSEVPQASAEILTIALPGLPPELELVHPAQVPRRKLHSVEGRIALIHAVCHIEYNAINLALDAIYRFQTMPLSYYMDWMQVAAEEASHFQMLSNRLQQLGSYYGAHSAHNGLWEMAVKTGHSVLHRMALVPRVLEARGLDVTPGMIERLTSVGDHETVALLEIILAEEVGHVEIGTRWYKHACAEAGVESQTTFIGLLKQYDVHTGKGPLHVTARKQAGFSQMELDALN